MWICCDKRQYQVKRKVNEAPMMKSKAVRAASSISPIITSCFFNNFPKIGCDKNSANKLPMMKLKK